MGESLPKKNVMSEAMSFCKMACNLFPICIGNKREKWSQVGHRYLFVYRFAQKSTCMRWTMIDDKGWSSHRFHTQHFFHIITIAFLLSTSTLTIPVANAPGATAQEPFQLSFPDIKIVISIARWVGFIKNIPRQTENQKALRLSE